MFGYITPLKSELKVREFEYFRSYYCGLCKEIKHEYGNLPRFCLNYDLTFIGFLLDGLNPNPLQQISSKCIRHPYSKLATINKTEALNYVCDLSIILFNYKLKDNIDDDNSLSSKVFYLTLSSSNKKSKSKLNNINSIIKSNLLEISKLEKSKSFNSLDEISHPFSNIMGTLLKEFPYKLEDESNELRNNLYWLGYFIGKWIYLMDAIDDLKKDMENSKFNPFIVLYNLNSTLDYSNLIKAIIQDVDLNILTCLSKCSEYIKIIPFKKHYEIIDNTINLGMMNKYYEILNKINSSLTMVN